MKEMTRSGIFSGNAENTTSEANSANSNIRTSIRVYQQALNGTSQISFSTEGNISPKKPSSLPEIAKQRELSGTYQSDLGLKIKKQTSSAKTKELSGSDIFAPPTKILPPSLAASRTLESKACPVLGQSNFLFGGEPVKKTLRKRHEQKFAEMMGNNIFKVDVPAGSPEKTLSRAKLREMSGNDIFADGNVESRDYIGGARRPPRWRKQHCPSLNLII